MSDDISISGLAKRRIAGAVRSGGVYVLGVDEFVGVLRSFVAGEIPASDVEDWAEVYDVNEDVMFDCEGYAKLIFELSSPEINGPLTIVRAEKIIEILGT